MPAIARVNANVIEVMFGPKQMPSGSALYSCPTAARVRSMSASQASAASNAPPPQPLRPFDIQSVIAWIVTSTICVPAGPSKRDHPSRTPGNR